MQFSPSPLQNFREKGANKKASFIKKKQKDIVLRLRQERAQLRCMQEAYRSICDKHHTLVTDKKKLLNESIFVPPQTSKNASLSSKASSQQKTKNYVKQKSDSSSTSTVLTEEEIRKSVEEEVPEEILEIKNEASHSSQGSILELLSSEPVISSQPSYDKLQEAASLPQLKQGHSQSSLSLHSNNSIESALQGHLTKREQRILQRRKHVEKILQWQMKLDSEELAVRELEQKAVELVDTSKKKTKYYISTSPSAIQDEKENTPSNGIPEYSINPSDSIKASASSDDISSKKISSEEVPESVPSDSVPEENIVTATSGESVEEEFSKKRSNGQESPSTMSSSSIQEMDQNQSTESSIKTTEEAAESSNTKVIVTNGRSHSPKSSTTNKSSSSDIYSESFESTASQKGSSPSISLVAIRTSIPSGSGRKEKGISIKSPLAPRNFRRHDSSGSDDSYTISHSETASDQSDIEVRIHALAEELRRRKYEAEKLKREQKRKYREHLKGTELSLKKQVEAYTQYIDQVKSDLEQIETMSSQSGDISSVKPQIKWPRLERVIDSRHIRKKTPLSPEALTPEKKTFDNTSSSPDSVDNTIDLSHKRGKPFIKKLFPDSKEKLKHEIGLSKEISLKAVVPETIFEKVSENISSLENSEQNLSTVTENLDILMKTSPVKKSSLNGNKSFSESKESEIEEESYESNSSVITVDSKSELSKTHTDESNSKFTYQSDSCCPTIDETLNTRNSAEDSEETLQDSFKSHTTDQIATNDSILSSEVEYVSESLSNTNAGSVKDELESGSFEYENSDADSTSSPRKLLDKTFNVESDSKTNLSPVDDSTLTETKSFNQREQQELSKKSIESVHIVTTNDKKSLKEGLKSQTFVVNVVNYIHSSILDDAIRTMLNLSKKCSNTSKYKNLSHSLTVKQLNEESVEILVNDLLNSHINEAISFVFNISNSYKKFQNGFMKSSSLTENYGEHELTSTCSDFSINAIDFDTQNYENNELKNAHSATTLNDYNIFKKQADWFEDGFVSAQWDAQQLEQQLLLQQYPYYYRKIPNKPPPPYTPPTVLSINYPLPIKKEKIVEQADPIKFVTKHIGLIIDNIAEVLISGKKMDR
ncbi:centrosome-associated protein 350 [Caerostris extrusa]|uniref:Centrosome-associated protein 350 n=1 Tax=Caerostris extrusa TaxID=172846 RepID=A0AAV4QH72_CAEEX|nr:centrosome-associated protein 350 [Caerostris extrusa]